MSETFTPITKYINVRAQWAPDFYNEGPESNKLRWTEAQVLLAEVTPRISGLIVCDAVLEGEIHVRRMGGAGMVCKNVITAGFTMDTLERLYTATFTETASTPQPVHFHIRFPSLVEYLEFTRAVSDLKLEAEGLRAEMEDGFAAVSKMLPSA
ncbi:hypothetical protein K466DRAFT_604825 [Polyporus arcularius HHB13444]|uniref:Uncharacterized protein n=1 Tax=Polyporus arcularius HHB13444 TaxID=1314778 RepID=A0A5C3NYD9_9APHY|nr:hypothetical protein K466DRAFT_604825 [Polyporus arcularius HHB13444]